MQRQSFGICRHRQNDLRPVRTLIPAVTVSGQLLRSVTFKEATGEIVENQAHGFRELAPVVFLRVVVGVSLVMVTGRDAVARILSSLWRCVLNAVCEKAGPVVRLFIFRGELPAASGSPFDDPAPFPLAFLVRSVSGPDNLSLNRLAICHLGAERPRGRLMGMETISAFGFDPASIL